MSEPLTPDLERWARGSFSPMAQRHAWNEVDRLRDELRRLREVLVHAAVPLEAISASVRWELCPDVMDAVNGAVVKIRAALLPAKGADNAAR